ncbi:unnamed protein product, partial [Brenthis ino]
MEADGKEIRNIINDSVVESQAAVNNLILDYYKKFGRKRDLEQFFSLSTAQSDIRDPSSLFWKKMKSQTDSDSGEKKSDSSTELGRISIQCSIPEASTSRGDYHIVKSDSESPPIINEEGQCNSRNSDNESVKSDDIHSQKSVDNTLDTSTNKPHSPTSSITSQRKLEWDSLADVGYANESDRKNSASSLSTLERLALHQQYSINDTKQNLNIGPPTAQSTPLDVEESKNKNKKGFSKKTTKIYKKDVDLVEMNVSNNEKTPQPINVNLTKHISFNVERDGGVTIENITKSVSVSPEKASTQSDAKPQDKLDKEIQTTLNKEKSSSSSEQKTKKQYPVLISLNTLKKRTRRKKVRKIQRKHTKKRLADKENIPLEKSGDQVSEAESFEYMPGHIYNLNQMKRTNEENRSVNNNKSSQESSAGLTTDSSRTTRHSFTKDLEKSIDILKIALDNRFEDDKLKKKLVKEVVQRLIKSKYKDDDSSTEFLSGLSFDSKKIDLYNSNRTSSTSDTNNTAQNTKQAKPKKSILRMDKFNSSVIASTSQSVPNLPTITNVENPIPCYAKKLGNLSNTDSDLDKAKNVSATGIDKTSSEELYKKYLDALRREQAYKKHLKDKELFMKQKLASSDVAFNITRQAEMKAQRIKDLMNDLVRNNYDDGSGDASKLEGSHSNINLEKYNSIRKQRSHSVFTLSSGNSDNNKHMCSSTKSNSKSCYKKVHEHYCCCPFHKIHPKVGVVDSSVQVNMTPKDRISPEEIPNTSRESKTQEIFNGPCVKCKLHQNKAQIVTDPATGEIKYVCLCADDSQIVPENFLIYKCSKLTNKCLKVCDTMSKGTNSASGQTSSNSTSPRQKSSFKSEDCEKKCLTIIDNVNQVSKSSQTNLNLPIKLQSRSSEQSIKSTSSLSSTNSHSKKLDNIADKRFDNKQYLIHEVTRWIQTEISIDPKISDPSLSDINIVTNKDCVQLASEQYKKVSRPNSESKVLKDFQENLYLRSSRSRSDVSNNIEERKSTNDYCNKRVEEPVKVIEKEDKEIQMIPDEVDNIQNDKQSFNNFTIPIQGTNMTLKVSLGSGVDGDTETFGKKVESIVTQVSKGTETVKKDVVENYTSIREECSKGVQSDNANIFDEYYKKSQTTCNYKNTDEDNLLAETQEKLNNKAPYYVNTCITEKHQYNTYPKNDRSHIQKPLLRSNTDTDTIETVFHTTFPKNDTKDVGYQPDDVLKSQMQSKTISTEKIVQKTQICPEKSLKAVESSTKSKSSSDTDDQSIIKTSNSEAGNSKISSKDPILDMIQDITKRYSKKDVEKSQRKKCFKEIITVLNYLLDTDESADDRNQRKESSTSAGENARAEMNLADKDSSQSVPVKTLVDKGIQLSTKKSKSRKTCTESSDLPISTDMPSTSTDAGTCKILNKIKRECERYHQKRCKCTGNICETSTSTSANCHRCKHVHHCSCKSHKCRSHKKSAEKLKKKCVAYNLIIQTSESMVSEEINYDNNRPQLKNIIVKVPSKRKVQNMPFKEISSKIENNMPHCSQRICNNYRSKSLPNDSEISSADDLLKKAQACTVREYLEKNRPDFVEKSSNRQHCLKVINETRANERAAKRQLLSMQLDRQQALNALTHEELMHFARELGNELRRKKVAPKFISEREMKKHSEKIYKSLPEVVRKKEEIKKANIKKTNLLMANIFKKNLQKKTLQGAVNLSNYNTVVKI